MRGNGPGVRAAAALALAGLLLGVAPAVSVLGQTPDRSDVVLVLDFSASILRDAANRNRFGAALERIADRVDATSADLVAGDTTVSIVQFATRAADYPGCADLELLGSPATVSHFAGCLRSVAGAYRKGLDPALTRKIGVDTNYVAAMEQAALHLPPDAVRPGLILFTDGKHDVKGVPVSQVLPARDRLFGSRSPFALLPVGMGLDPKERGPLASGLQQLQVTRDMPACASGATVEWPQVVFDSADRAGDAVAVALQDATCTFTVAPTPLPSISPAGPSPSASAAPVAVAASIGPAEPAASPISDAVRPCGSALDCNPVMLAALGGLAAVLLVAILVSLVVLVRGRSSGYVIAVVDVVYTANVGHGSNLGISFLREPGVRGVSGIAADRGRHAEVRFRRLRDDRFAVRDRAGRHVVADGAPLVVVDSMGVRHSLVLQAFATNAASKVGSRG